MLWVKKRYFKIICKLDKIINLMSYNYCFKTDNTVLKLHLRANIEGVLHIESLIVT